jgi:hypothetical protein
LISSEFAILTVSYSKTLQYQHVIDDYFLYPFIVVCFFAFCLLTYNGEKRKKPTLNSKEEKKDKPYQHYRRSEREYFFIAFSTLTG